MSFFRYHRDPWLDRELKKVPLPEGLLARLKQIGTGPDAELDAALCEVPLPEGMLGRLKDVARDAALDKQLRGVPVPASLMRRLHAIGSDSEEEFDAQLREMPLPAGLRERLRAIPSTRERNWARWMRKPVVQWTLAASLMIGTALIYLGTVAGFMMTAYQFEPTQTEKAASKSPRKKPSSSFFDETPFPKIEWPPKPGAFDSLDEAAPADQTAPPTALAETESPAAGTREAVNRFRPAQQPDAERPVLVATPALPDTLPEPEIIELRPPRGVVPPRVKEFDLLTLLRDGVHPFVEPSAHAQLAVSQVPLVTRTTSYQQAREWVRQGRLPESSEIRVEEFLAAVDYDFLPPQGNALAIRTAAGPSPFGEEGMNLVQVGVQAGKAPEIARQVTHLTLAIDVSASMRRGERLASIQRAITDFLPHMEPRDELAVVIFSEQAEVLIERATREDLPTVVPALESIVPRSSNNLGAGLQLAADVALTVPAEARMARRLVVLTDGLGQVPQSVVARLELLVADTVNRGVQVEVIDVGPPGAIDLQLDHLAQTAGTELRRADGAEAIRYSLQEILTGQSQIVARAAQLTVKFNPATVESYRLLGHEADSTGGLVGGTLEADLHAGEAATGLYEVKLKPQGGDDVAEVTLAWHDPQTGVENRLVQRISRLQFATSLLESPVSLQRAAVVAETAEIFRISKFAPSHTVGLRRVAELVSQLSPPALENESFQQFLEVLHAAQNARSGRAARPVGMGVWWQTARR